jgi:hypothetical protein
MTLIKSATRRLAPKIALPADGLCTAPNGGAMGSFPSLTPTLLLMIRRGSAVVGRFVCERLKILRKSAGAEIKAALTPLETLSPA